MCIWFTAVISALKNLQDKIRKLEVERGAAENNLKTLAQETTRYKDILQKERENDAPVQSTVSKHTQGQYYWYVMQNWYTWYLKKKTLKSAPITYIITNTQKIVCNLFFLNCLFRTWISIVGSRGKKSSVGKTVGKHEEDGGQCGTGATGRHGSGSYRPRQVGQSDGAGPARAAPGLPRPSGEAYRAGKGVPQTDCHTDSVRGELGLVALSAIDQWDRRHVSFQFGYSWF